jgi:general secretion pathway protein L
MVMQAAIYIYLHSDNLDQVSYVVVDAEGQVNRSDCNVGGEQIAELCIEKQITVFVPNEHIFFTSVNLPKLSRAKLIQAIPFALEEQLIDEIDTLHFAVSEQSAAGDVAVAVISHANMQKWFDQFKRWHIQPDLLLPDCLCLPYQEYEWMVCKIGTRAIVRTGLLQGFACNENMLSTWMSMAKLHTESQPNNIQEQIINDGLALLTQFKQGHLPAFNLLQGKYQIKKKSLLKINKLWRPIAYVSAAWLTLILLYPMGSYLILKTKTYRLQSQIAQLYKKHFPQTARVTAPRTRLNEKLQHAMSSVGNDRLMQLLACIGKGMSQSTGMMLKHLDYQNDKLTLDVSASSSENFSAFMNYLSQQGLHVVQQNAALVGTRIAASLEIT